MKTMKRTPRRKCCCMSRRISKVVGAALDIADRIFFKKEEEEGNIETLFISSTRQITIDSDNINDMPNVLNVSKYPDLKVATIIAEVDVIIDGDDYHLSTSIECTEQNRLDSDMPYFKVLHFELAGASRRLKDTDVSVSAHAANQITEALIKELRTIKQL